MNFLGVGPLELVVVLVVALLVVGPERLPRLAADLARTIREIRKYTGSLAAEFNEVVKDIDRETAEERTEWKQIGEGLTGATQSVTDALREARSDAEGPPAAAPSANGHAPAVTEADKADAAPAAAAPAAERTEGVR
jgi:sec-independent protein translocase protein TatB